MQIQRVIEESMGVCGQIKADIKVDLRMKNHKISDEPEASVSEANTSFLRANDKDNCTANNERSINDRIVYATIDRLALKRTRLPLQLVPIEDNTSAVEKKEKINGEKRVNGSRKTSPRRPSFKVRPGIPMSSGPWKSRSVRSSPRGNQGVGKFENVSKELVSRLIIFENIIRNNNNGDCGTLEDRVTAARGTDQEVPVTPPEAIASRDKHSEVIHSGSHRDSRVNEEIADRPSETSQKNNSLVVSSENRDADASDSSANRAEDFNLEDNGTKDETVAQKSASLTPEASTTRTSEENDEFFEPIENDVFTSQKHLLDSCSASTSTSSLSSKTKRYKPEFTFAKNVLNYVPITSQTKRSKKTLNSGKKRENEAKSNLQSSKGKSFSREELRHLISLPTNFVHLASATNSTLLNDDNVGNTKGKVITHEEKCAKLEYLGNDDYQEIEVSNVAGKIVRNSREDRTTYVEIKQKTTVNFTDEKRRSSGFDETSSHPVTSSTTSSSSSSTGDIRKDVDNNFNRAKVSSLENSQGVPEVVKRSENEGNDKYVAKPEEEDTIAPVYEAMSEFSINTYGAPAVAAALRSNSSFLWGERVTRSFDKEIVAARINDEIGPSGHENNVPNGRTFDDDGYDAYDDVGLSRDDAEEDHYDDVGLPSKDAINSSTDTIFEEIDADGDGELYDDVLPGPISKNSVLSTNGTSGNSSDSVGIKCSNSSDKEISEKVDDLLLVKRPSSLSLENSEQESYENQYLSISNDYSSVEEGLDDFEGEEDDGLYDDVELPSQERVNSLYAGSSSGSQLGSLYNGKESEWEDLEEAAPVQQLAKKTIVASRLADPQATPSKKKAVQRWSRKVRRQKSKASRKNPSSRGSATRGTSTFSDTASDDSNYETLFSFPSDEFSSGSEDEDSSRFPSNPNGDVTALQSRINGVSPEAPSRPVPPPPRESSLTETFGKRMKMLRRTWSITKGSLGRMRRRTSTIAETETNPEEGGKYANCEQQQNPNNDARKYFNFKKHFKKSSPGLSTFYLDNENNEGRLSRNNNCSKEEVYSDFSNNSWYTNTDYWKTGVNEQSQRNNVDHYSMLDEEPLYQFYAAAAARVAFESDSEGYEEVEDPTPSPSTVDLAKPGHRTLWCQTPQIINSTLLQRLTSDEKKMQEAKFEIFTSEASYLNSLRVLVDEFLNDHELVHEVLTPSEREKLFGGVPSVLLASERLLAELETVWREDVMFQGLPEVLLNYAQRSSSVYVAYCSNQVSIDTTLKELRSKKGSKFEEAVKRIESHSACQSLSLHSFLMLPMQRVTRLPLLADAVLSKVSADNKDERTCWECVLSQLSQVVMECNEGARAAGRLVEMEALERKLEYSSKVPPIVLRDRYLIRRGPVVQMLAKSDAEYKLTFGKKHHKASLYLLLLTDYLLIAKQKPNANEETYTVIDTCKRSLVALEKVTEDSPFAGRHAMVLSLLENYSGRHVEYILTCKNATERERWLDAVSPPKPSLVGETLYETWDCPQVMALYPYAAAQPDELTLQPGDVINVLRKMTDGWHLGEKLLGGEQGWFPGNYAKEVASEHVRARNLRQRHRLLALSASVLQQRAKQTSRLY